MAQLKMLNKYSNAACQSNEQFNQVETQVCPVSSSAPTMFSPLLSVAFVFVCVSVQTATETVSQAELDQTYADEIKEFHFHVYFFQDNSESNRSAELLFSRIQYMTRVGFFHAVPLRINLRPDGPHTIGSFEVWCPKEHFSRAYSWFLLNRGQHIVLVHPLTKEEVKDHTERSAWMGATVPLDLTALNPLMDHVPLQYPELGLGYSAPADASASTVPVTTTRVANDHPVSHSPVTGSVSRLPLDAKFLFLSLMVSIFLIF